MNQTEIKSLIIPSNKADGYTISPSGKCSHPILLSTPDGFRHSQPEYFADCSAADGRWTPQQCLAVIDANTYALASLATESRPLALPCPKYVTLNPGYIDAADVRRICHVSRLTAFELNGTRKPSYVEQITHWQKYKRKSYPRNTNLAYITSYACVSVGAVTVTHALLGTILRKAPAGMVFEKHSDGYLRLRRLSDDMDYHPSAKELYRKDFASFVRRQMAINWRRRVNDNKLERERARKAKQDARTEAAYQKQLASVYVSLNDSRIAGNCVEGTLAFCERKLRISRKEILDGGHLLLVSAVRLLKVANGDRSRIDAACRVAWRRENTVSI